MTEQPSDPVTSDPVTSDPVTSDPVTSDPVTSDPVTSATDRLTKEGATPGEDPREIDVERADAATVAVEQSGRPIRHGDQVADPATEMGTSSARDIDADDPLEHDA